MEQKFPLESGKKYYAKETFKELNLFNESGETLEVRIKIDALNRLYITVR